MIFDLGDDSINLRSRGKLEIRPCCMGCWILIEDGKIYFVNNNGALVSHPNGWCREQAKINQLPFYNSL